ncbi:sensor histidine kinase NtrY-like [Chelatococcus reniformis]|uniref:sensor histidine kinase NtrY-like n=1 Tax=Chelatococcus reniformis TaxID=1494448 RepID=UPI001FCEB020|nr:PAS domain-containing sensor histidine kinase [Chelatococcus reniformis]
MSGVVGVVLVIAALTSALLTFMVLAGMTPILPTHFVVVWMLFVNALLVLALLSVVLWEAVSLYRARRRGAAGAGLHVRIVGLFCLVAAFPAILVAFVASVSLERGLDPWFITSIKALMGNTVEIAKAYRETQCRTVVREAGLMAADLNRAKVLYDADRKLFRDFLVSRSDFLGFPITILMRADGDVVERVDSGKIENVPLPSEQDLKDAGESSAVCLIPEHRNIFGAVQRLPALDGMVLFVARPVDPKAIEFLPVAEAGVAYYQALEEKKVGIQIAFASMFALVALIVLLSAVWFGLGFANRIVSPVRRLIHATDQVATGNFYVQVPINRSEGDFGHLSETFNKMTGQLRRQHDGLVSATDVMDRRRRFTEAVLSGVSAGVVGVDARGRVTIVNPSAEVLLQTRRDQLVGRPIDDVLPEIAELKQEAHETRRLVQRQIAIERDGRERTLDVRVTSEHSDLADEGVVVTLDDITDLVHAQRTSAWADVARRIAHEIKNPLTPIQLSAERIRRKYGKVITTDRDVFDQCTATIIRQVDDIKRMVDEFSSFARMPAPVLDTDDIGDTVRQVIFLLQVAHPDIDFIEHLPRQPLRVRFDRRLVSQAVQNIIKNATEGIQAVPAADRGKGVVAVSVVEEPGGIVAIEVTDNGKGFPKEHRLRLLEPYMTSREGGTGLGLPIVLKIFEEHGGSIELLDAPAVAEGGQGARVRMWFPKSGGAEASPPDEKTGGFTG